MGIIVTLGFIAALAFAAASPLSAQQAHALNPGVPWPATDGLHRELPAPEDVGPPKPNRTVGIFYFLTHSETSGKSPNWDGPYDVARILAADPDALSKPDSPLWGPIGMFHYWGEPLYGYYRSDDPWVLRRHAQLLADAGVDTLIFDTTNAVTYPEVYMKLCEVFQQVRREGGRTPQICFMVNTEAGKTAQRIYEDLYKPNLYPDLWFHWKGKPLIICDPGDATPDVKAFFTLRKAHWPFELVNTPYAWHWEATYPQPYGYTDDPNQPEQINVAVAQNLRAADGQVTNMSYGDARGRSFHDGKQNIAPGSVNYGYNFQEQWKRVFALDPPFVMITGWNEWTAGRWGEPHKPIVFVDQFDEEYSRDIEPMKGGHADNYYWQMIANIRRYKGAPPLPAASAPKSIRIDGPFDQWRDVLPEYTTEVGEAMPRDSAGVVGLHYENRTGRNQIVACKVAASARTVSFYMRAAEPIHPAAGAAGLWLLIDTRHGGKTAWEGFDFIVNRDVSDGKAWLERSLGGWQWRKVAPVKMKVKGRELQVAVPRSALGLAAAAGKLALDFKWIDNAQSLGDPMDLYVSGCTAPAGRFRYRYVAR
jgi:hypothetical protein